MRRPESLVEGGALRLSQIFPIFSEESGYTPQKRPSLIHCASSVESSCFRRNDSSLTGFPQSFPCDSAYHFDQHICSRRDAVDDVIFAFVFVAFLSCFSSNQAVARIGKHFGISFFAPPFGRRGCAGRLSEQTHVPV